MQAIDGLEADVLTIENSRSGNEMINALAKYGYSRVSICSHSNACLSIVRCWENLSLEM